LKFNILSHSNNFNLGGDTVDLEIMVVVKVRVVVKVKASFIYAHIVKGRTTLLIPIVAYA
jgi:hypothetical protein